MSFCFSSKPYIAPPRAGHFLFLLLALLAAILFPHSALATSRYGIVFEGSCLVETNPAFTNQKQWLSSDYMLAELKIDPAKTQKRLGDGFYEQQLVRNQVMSLSGRSILGSYADEEAQFLAMMTAGAKLSKELGIRPGISLTADQVARLTDNIVVMETREVGGEKVLVPVVYLAQVNEGQLLTGGPLIAAADIDLADTRGFSNSGTVRADNTLRPQG